MDNTQTKQKQIAQMYKDGIPVSKICEMMNVSTATVYKDLKAEGVVCRNIKVVNRCLERKAEIISMYKGGIPIDTICGTLGVSQSTVYKYLREEGIITRSKAYDSKNKRRNAEILGLYKAGYNFTKIARTLHMSNDTVSNVLHDAGVTVRRKWAPLTDEVREGIISMYLDGTPRKEISETLQVSESTISTTLRARGYCAKKGGCKTPKEDKSADPGYVFRFDRGEHWCYDAAPDCKYWEYGNCTKCECSIFIDVDGTRMPCEFYEEKTA